MDSISLMGAVNILISHDGIKDRLDSAYPFVISDVYPKPFVTIIAALFLRRLLPLRLLLLNQMFLAHFHWLYTGS